MPCSDRRIVLDVVVGIPPAVEAGTVSENGRLIWAVLWVALVALNCTVINTLAPGLRSKGVVAAKLAVNVVEPTIMGCCEIVT